MQHIYQSLFSNQEVNFTPKFKNCIYNNGTLFTVIKFIYSCITQFFKNI